MTALLLFVAQRDLDWSCLSGLSNLRLTSVTVVLLSRCLRRGGLYKFCDALNEDEGLDSIQKHGLMCMEQVQKVLTYS